MKPEKIPKQGTTLTRKAFWDDVLDIVGSQKKVEGKNVKVTEFDGYGTIISVIRAPATGACCVDADCSIQTESDCSGMGGTYQGDGTPCDPNPCSSGTCGCGSRMTATFSGVSSAACLLSFTNWPLGRIVSGFWGNLWVGFYDPRSAYYSCSTFPSSSDDCANVQVRCSDDGSGWSVTVDDCVGSAYFSAFGTGSIPIGTPINNALTAGGEVVLTCGGVWGTCCACCADVCGGTICFGCPDFLGVSGGMGEAQCENLNSWFYPDCTTAATWNGDGSVCIPTPCDFDTC